MDFFDKSRTSYVITLKGLLTWYQIIEDEQGNYLGKIKYKGLLNSASVLIDSNNNQLLINKRKNSFLPSYELKDPLGRILGRTKLTPGMFTMTGDSDDLLLNLELGDDSDIISDINHRTVAVLIRKDDSVSGKKSNSNKWLLAIKESDIDRLLCFGLIMAQVQANAENKTQY